MRKMYHYQLYGCLLETDIRFVQLVNTEGKNREAEIKIYQGQFTDEITKKIEEGVFYNLGEKTSWLDRDECAILVQNGNTIIYNLKQKGAEMLLCSYILGFGMCMLFLQRNEMVIHCSALHNGKEAILIAGESGSGKSTITNFYLEQGWRLMADDAALVKYDKSTGETMVYPAFPYQKLCRNVAVERGYDLNELIYINEQRDKFLVPCRGNFDLTPKPLKKFITLGLHQGEDVIVKEMQGLDKFHVCVNNLGLRHLLGPEKYAPHIGQKCLELIANVDVHLIARPAGKDTTEEIKKAAFDIIL